MANDIRIVKTERNIQQALITLLDRKSFRLITIADLCKEAMSSRSTFYIHYLDKYDLLEKMVATQTRKFEVSVNARIHQLMTGDFQKSLTEFYHELTNQQRTIQSLFQVHEPNADLRKNFEDILQCHWQKLIQKRSLSPDAPVELIAKFGTSMVFDILNWTFIHGIDERAIKFAERLRRQIFDS
jgi:AcrR family transcriptional regulator